jgi:DnaJ family protein A protein 2
MSFHGFGGAGQRKAVDNEKLYQILGIDKSASEQDVKKAYRRLAMTHHPDKGGTAEKFSEIQRAYEVLGNTEKRQLYDQGGEEAVERGGVPDDDGGMDIFDIFGGGGRRGKSQRGPQKGEPVIFPLNLTLEEMFTGCVKKLRLTRSVACKGCDGKGGSQVVSCSTCQGRGIRVVVQRLGPGMISQQQMTCSDCSGQGQVVNPSSRCTQCMGEKTVKEKKQLDVHVPPGCMPNQSHIFASEGDQVPGQSPGDVVVKFEGKQHERFQRRGIHLFYKLKISLLQALSGFTAYVEHLDGSFVEIKSDKVVKPGDVMVLEELGFPVSYGQRRGIDSGHLYVEFDIVFPTQQELDAVKSKKINIVNELSKVLPNVKYEAVSRPKPNVSADQIHSPHPRITSMETEEKKIQKDEKDYRAYQQQQERQQYSEEEEVHVSSGGPACQPM